jgi:glycosyltransferase involved in cell wall biosynthesis
MRLIIIPVYNEERYIRKILIDLSSLNINVDILLIDDGSNDKTGRILNEMGMKNIIIHRTNRGYGKSIIDGFKFAAEHNYSYVITMDGDGQHELKYLPLFFNEIKRFDIVSGSRYLPDSPWS